MMTQYPPPTMPNTPGAPRPAIGRRASLTGVVAALAARRALAAAPAVRLGILHFGSVQWVAEIIHQHGLDASNGFDLATVTLANTDAGRVALMAGAADIVVSDLFFAAAQRAAGMGLCFAPFFSGGGGIMVPNDSPVHALSDLADLRLGVAGGPLDKSWLLVQAAAKAASGIDLANAARVNYGAPPLLNAMLQRHELDAVLTFWNFAARLDGQGFREAIPVSDCALALGLSARPGLIGYVFHEAWARANPASINGFLAASAAAQDLLAGGEAAWREVRPLMEAPDDSLFENLRRRFVDGIPHAPSETQERDAATLIEIVRLAGGSRGTEGLETLPPGVFWRSRGG